MALSDRLETWLPDERSHYFLSPCAIWDCLRCVCLLKMASSSFAKWKGQKLVMTCSRERILSVACDGEARVLPQDPHCERFRHATGVVHLCLLLLGWAAVRQFSKQESGSPKVLLQVETSRAAERLRKATWRA